MDTSDPAEPAVVPDFGADAVRFQRAFMPGLEEWVEALLVVEFARARRVMPMAEVEARARSVWPAFELSWESYFGGLSDMTGELRRMAVNALSTGLGGQEAAVAICEVIRQCVDGTGTLPPASLGRHRNKVSAMKNNLVAVERVCYQVKVRGAEFPPDVVLKMLGDNPGADDDYSGQGGGYDGGDD
jgi:predicted translin family RNA/ssDNA-binding protein